MRSAILLLTLCTAVLAEESAADLFYKAFWLEQAEGKTQEASDLYNRILAEHPDAPEVPRVLLGLARIHGGKTTYWLERLRKDFPDSEERNAAEDLVPVERERFEPDTEAPSAVDRKIAKLFRAGLSNNITPADRQLLVELGLRAQPMLGELIRQTDFLPVLEGARILMGQRLATSERILVEALEDAEVLYKNAIVMAFAEAPCVSEELVDAMIAYHGRTRSDRKRDIVGALANQLRWKTPAHQTIYRFLTDRILNGEESEIESAAGARPRHPTAIPDAYLDAIFRKARWAMAPGLDNLVARADRPGIADRTLGSVRTFLDKSFDPQLRDWGPGVRVRLMADIGLKYRKELPVQGTLPMVEATLGAAVRKSRDTAAETILLALKEDDAVLYHSVRRWMRQPRDPNHYMRLRLGEKHLRALRRAAIDSFYRDGNIAGDVLLHLGLDADDFDMALEVHGAHPDYRNQSLIFDLEFIAQLQPEQLERLAGACNSGAQVAQLLESAADSLDVATFRVLLSRDDYIPWQALQDFGKRGPQWAEVIAHWVLDQTEKSWGFEHSDFVNWWGWKEASTGPIRSAFLRGELREELLGLVADERLPLAQLAIEAALEDGNQEALTRALASPSTGLRTRAIRAIEDPGQLIRYYEHARTRSRDYAQALERLGEIGGEEAAKYLADVVKDREQEIWLEWRTWLKLQPREAAHHALAAFEDRARPEGYRDVALDILTRSDLPQRIDVFRKILAGHAEGNVGLVLRTVRDQYLVELGMETLGYLRSPDKGLRDCATQAIERIKFYAEAKKALEIRPVIPAAPPKSR